MNLTQLSKVLLEKIKAGKDLEKRDYPSDLILESNVVATLKSLERYTNKESFLFKKEKGPVGWEYAISVMYLVDTLYLSSPISGNYSQVNVSSRYSINPVYEKENKEVKFEISFNDKKYKTKAYVTEKLKEGVLHGIVASFHTHPKFYHDKYTTQYTFFSAQDLSVLLSSTIPMLGLIAGNHLWIACRTNESSMIPPDLLNQATKIELEKGIDDVENFVKESLNKYGILFFSGKVGGKLRKL